MKELKYFLLIICILITTMSLAQNNALDFDGLDDEVVLTHFERPNIFTIELWIKGTEITSDERDVLAWATNDISQGAFTAEILTANGYIGYAEFDGANFPITPGVFYADGNWHHIAVTRNEDQTDNLKFYFDGTLTSISTININITTDNLKIGSESFANQDYRYFKGTLDELRIWDYEKTQAQIQNQLNIELIGDEAGLLAYYNFNQGIAGGENSLETTLNDASPFNIAGSLNNFTLMGPVSNWVRGVDGLLLSVDSDFEMAALSLSVFPNPSSDFIKVNELTAEANYEIYNTIGQKVKRGVVLENEKIDIQNLTNGIYVLKLGDGNRVRFIKE